MWRAYNLLSIGFDMIFLRTNARKNQVHRYRTATARAPVVHAACTTGGRWRASRNGTIPSRRPVRRNCVLKSTGFSQSGFPTCGACPPVATAHAWRTAWAFCNVGGPSKRRVGLGVSTSSHKRGTVKAITLCSTRPCWSCKVIAGSAHDKVTNREVYAHLMPVATL